LTVGQRLTSMCDGKHMLARSQVTGVILEILEHYTRHSNGVITYQKVLMVHLLA
jgi:hypothetical protein